MSEQEIIKELINIHNDAIKYNHNKKIILRNLKIVLEKHFREKPRKHEELILSEEDFREKHIN